MDDLLKAIDGVFKSYEFYSYVEKPKDDWKMDEYDYMMKPLWEKLKEEYDKVKSEK